MSVVGVPPATAANYAVTGCSECNGAFKVVYDVRREGMLVGDVIRLGDLLEHKLVGLVCVGCGKPSRFYRVVAW